jgi:hypothetical protein
MEARSQRSEDVGARGSAEAGSTPSLAQPPSEKDGALEVEVLAGERPVPGANVRLYWRGPRDPNLGEVSWRLASAGATNAQGRVRLASGPGSYQVAVHAQGYAALLRDVVRPYGEALTSLRLTLQSGETLTGRTVVRGTEEPLPMVELVLTAHGREMDRWQRVESPAEERVYASSDARGNFRVEGLAPGKFMLEARAPGHARAVLRSVQVPASGPLTVALHVAGVIEGFVVDAQGNPAADAEVQVSGRAAQVVTSGQGGGFSVELEPGTYSLSARKGEAAGSLEKPVSVAAGKTVRDVKLRLGQGAALEGRVVAHASGAPIAGASVDASPAGSDGDSGRAMTDGEGRFSVVGLAPGSYDLVANAPGFSSEIRRRLTVASGERFTLELQLTGTGAAEGHVKDEAGRPVEGVQVMAGTPFGGPLSSAISQARTDAEGRYRIEGLEVGPLMLMAGREGVALKERQRVDVTEGETARADFTLKETGTVEGTVRAHTGRLPTESLAVMAFPMGGMRFQMGPPDLGRVDLEPSGLFRMALPPGSYGLNVVPRERMAFGGFSPTQVRVEAGKTVQAELTWRGEASDSSALQGVVLEPDGMASVGATVMLSSADGSPRGMAAAQADDEGHFSLTPPVMPGAAPSAMRLTATHGGRKGELLVNLGEQRDVVVKLQPAASLRGQVVRPNGGAPVKGFTLTVRPPSRVMYLGANDAWEFPGDRFELGDVPAERVTVVAQTQSGESGEATVTLAPGASAEVQVVLKATAEVRGRLIDAVTKEPLQRAMVLFEGEGPIRPGAESILSSEGRFTLKGVRAGEHMLLIMGAPFMERVRRPVTLAEGQVLDLGDIPVQPRPTPGPPPP